MNDNPQTIASPPPSPSPTVINLGSGGNSQTQLPGKRWFNPKMFFLLGGLLILLVGLGIGTFLVQKKQSQSPQSKAASNGKSGCSDTCSGNPPSCSGNTTNGTSCSEVTVPGMPDNFDAWALDDQNYKSNTKCTVRPGTTTADCTCDVGGGTYCWMPLTYLVKNVDNQGHRFYMLVYDKATGNQIGGSKTEFVAYLDNPSKQARWGYDSGHDGTWIVQNCGQRKEYHEQADLFSPGSWVDTGTVLYAEATGTGCNPPSQTAVCDSLAVTPSSGTPPLNVTAVLTGHTANGGSIASYKFDFGDGTSPVTQASPTLAHTFASAGNFTVKGFIIDNKGNIDGGSGSCQQTATITLQGTAACQMVAADKDLSALKVGDVVTFSGWGITSDNIEQIDKVRFIISNTASGGAVLSDTTVAASRDTSKDTSFGGKAWKGVQAYTIPGPGNYSVSIMAHWVSKNQWMQ